MNGSPVTAVVRAWVDLYTRGMPADIRAARRDEIDDDLWCQAEEAVAIGRSPRALDADLLLRLVFGIPADVSWRLASRGPAPAVSFERNSSMSIRAIGGAAVVAGLSYGILLLLFIPFGETLWIGDDRGAFPLGVWPLVGTWVGVIAFIWAGVGLAFALQDHVRPVGAIGALMVLVGALVSMGGSIVPLLVGSAMLMWDLARLGLVPRFVPIVHVATAIVASVAQLQGRPGLDEIGGRALLVALLAPFLLSWIAVGASLSRRASHAHDAGN